MRMKTYLPILILAMLASTISAGYTDEQVKWWLLSNLPGVCAECPDVIAFYKERLEALEQPRILPDRPATDPQEHEETMPLNATHNLVIYHKRDIYGNLYTYNVTRLVSPPEPTYTTQNISINTSEAWLTWPDMPEIDALPPFEIYMPPSLLERIKALEARIEALEARVAALEECICHT